MNDEEIQALCKLNSVPAHDYSIAIVILGFIALIVGAILLRGMLPIVPEYKYTEN